MTGSKVLGKAGETASGLVGGDGGVAVLGDRRGAPAAADVGDQWQARLGDNGAVVFKPLLEVSGHDLLGGDFGLLPQHDIAVVRVESEALDRGKECRKLGLVGGTGESRLRRHDDLGAIAGVVRTAAACPRLARARAASSGPPAISIVSLTQIADGRRFGTTAELPQMFS